MRRDEEVDRDCALSIVLGELESARRDKSRVTARVEDLEREFTKLTSSSQHAPGHSSCQAGSSTSPSPTPLGSLVAVRDAMRRFTLERDWSQFHTPKNLCMALTGEVGELMELMQWKTDEEILKLTSSAVESQRDDRFVEAVGDEMSDVLLYLVRLADVLEIDLGKSAALKMAKNARKYPVELAKGNAKKYNELAAVGDAHH